MSLEQLNAHEDDIDDDDALETYRRRRLAELKQAQASAQFGALLRIGQTDYKGAVTEASAEAFVAVLLTDDGNEACALLDTCFGEVARRFPAVKFVSIAAQAAMANYPRNRCPTVLVYHRGQIVGQFVGASAWAGAKTNADVVEWVLARNVKGMLPTSSLDSDPRTSLLKTKITFGTAKQRALSDDDDDDDY